jgi:hypothetical protein
VYRPSSSMVDYTAERRKTEREREKRKMFPHYITGGPTTQREEVLRERKIKFLNFIVCVCVFVCVCVCVCVCVFVCL